MSPKYKDLHEKPEDDRIDEIGKAVMARRGTGKTIAVCVDSEPGKADRYIRKLTRKFPEIVTWEKLAGPTAGVTSIIVHPPD